MGIQRARQVELVGEWDWIDGFSEFPNACGTDVTIQYHRNGEWFFWGESGTWKMKGAVLTEAITEVDPKHSDKLPADIGKKYVSTLQWVEEDKFLKRYSDGDVMVFLRCPKID